jgi:16S rRNA processing protein RimM
MQHGEVVGPAVAGSADRVIIGQVVRPHGKRGDLVVRPLAAEHEGIFRTGSIFFSCDGAALEMTVTGVRWHKGDVLLRVEGVSDRDAAEEFRGCQVELERKHLPPLDPDTYLEDDLIGCRLIDPEGRFLGTVDGILRTGAVDVLTVDSEDGRWMMPAAGEMLVRVDPGEKIIEVALIEGLRELKC